MHLTADWISFLSKEIFFSHFPASKVQAWSLMQLINYEDLLYLVKK